MAVGNPVTAAQLNAALAQLAIQICLWSRQVSQLQQLTVSLGTAGLETAGMSAGDAATFQTMASYLNTPAGVYLGTATQGTQFNFDDALVMVRGGQPV